MGTITMTKRGKRRKTRKEKNLLERMAASVKATNLAPRASQPSQAKLVSMFTMVNSKKIKKEFQSEKSPQRKLSSQTYRVLSAAVKRGNEGLVKKEPKVEAKEEFEDKTMDDDVPVSCSSLT